MESEDENVTAIRGSVMVYCTECGFANEQGNAFCSQCGSPLEQPEANPAAPAYDDNALTLVKQPAAPLPAVGFRGAGAYGTGTHDRWPCGTCFS